MCGIVGLIAKNKQKGLDYKARNIFEQMLYVDTLRGEDGTGVYLVNKFGNVKWAKEATEAHAFVEEKPAKNIFQDIGWDGVFVVGHNRKATKGKLSDENTHPFISGDTILVHNGTISNQKDLDATAEVDSHAIAKYMAVHGEESTAEAINGAFAIISYDLDKKRLSIMRNNQRPLWMAETEDYFIFASEPWMIFGIAWRNNTKTSKLREVTEKRLFTYTIQDDDNTILQEIKDLEFYKPPTENFTQPNTQGTQGKSIGFTKKSPLFNWKKGDLVVFNPKTILRSKGQIRLSGEHKRFNDVEIQVILDDKTFPWDDAKTLADSNEVVGYVKTVYFDGRKHKLYCDDMGASIPYVSRNGSILDEEVLLAIDLCDLCHNNIDEDSIGDSYIKIKRNGELKCVCPSCVEKALAKNPNWGNIRNYENQVGSL